ncbi:MAG: NAD(P)H-dependent oxidoreductase subunit E [Acidobacteriota bacterium]|nr:NAD(P)H-dependent oxidoreductase subunit E [Acidobacteriota bacterium]MDW3229108.1 NAD(P)H-dependent oxidoreductase subunit E [Acidobacteriota bacterium]
MKSQEVYEEEIEKIVKSLPADRRHLILFLHQVQQKFGYIPEAAVLSASDYFSLTPAEVYGVVTFYSAFRQKAGCKHEVIICQGTACHVRGGEALKNEFWRLLKLGPGGEDPEKNVALRTVNCLGCCALAPVVVVDGQYQAKVNLNKVKMIVDQLEKN